jgi:AraC family transcriptional activator of pobA
MHQAFAQHPVRDTQAVHQIDGYLFEDAGAHPALNIGAVATLDHHRIDAAAAQQVSEEHARRAGPDDRDLGTHRLGSSRGGSSACEVMLPGPAVGSHAFPVHFLGRYRRRRYVASVSVSLVPSFYLYGEPHRTVARDFVHVEELDERSRPSDWTIRPHAHADLVQVFLIDRGGGAMLVEDHRSCFMAPSLLLVPAGIVHGFEWSSDSMGAVVTLAGSHLEELVARHPDLTPLFARPRVLDADVETVATIRRAAAALARELGWSAQGHHAAGEAALLSLLVAGLRCLPPGSADARPEPGNHAALVARFRARIEPRFRLRESIAAHATALGTSETSLRTACARIAGRSPAAMLDDRAMLEARRALLYSDLSVAEIGYAIGFADPAYFSRFFTRHAGLSPRRYRHERERPGPQVPR